MKTYNEGEIAEILKENKKVAVVGISAREERDSYRVAEYLRDNGYDIIPVNPVLEQWNGVKSHESLSSIDGKIDIVDVFRKPEAVMEIAKEAVSVGASVLWLQEGVINEEAADYASEHGLKVVMDRCMMKEHARLD